MKKEIRSTLVAESLADLQSIQNTVKESTKGIVQDIIKESVRNEFKTIINEAEEKEEKETEVKDTNEVPEVDATEETQDNEGEKATDANSEESVEVNDDTFVSDDSQEAETENPWSEFEKYKVPGTEDEYDTTNASDEETIRMFKLMNDEDEVIIKDNGDGTIGVKDNETGAEYIIDTNQNSETEIPAIEPTTEPVEVPTEEPMETPVETPVEASEETPEEKEDENIFEIVLDDENMEEPQITENEGMAIPNIRRKTVKPDLPHINDNGMVNVQESKYNELYEKYNELKQINEELKNALGLFRTKLQENAVLNNNLVKIVKIIRENSTTKEEKNSIIERFDKEAKTIEDGNKLYESIKAELKKKPIVESVLNEKPLTVEGTTKINETVMLDNLDDSVKRFFEIAKIK